MLVILQQGCVLLGQSLEAIVISHLMRRGQSHASDWNQRAIVLDCIHDVGQAVHFKEVFGRRLNLHIGVNLLSLLILSGRQLTFGLLFSVGSFNLDKRFCRITSKP